MGFNSLLINCFPVFTHPVEQSMLLIDSSKGEIMVFEYKYLEVDFKMYHKGIMRHVDNAAGFLFLKEHCSFAASCR